MNPSTPAPKPKGMGKTITSIALITLGVFIGSVSSFLIAKVRIDEVESTTDSCIDNLKKNNDIAIQANADLRSCTSRLIECKN